MVRLKTRTIAVLTVVVLVSGAVGAQPLSIQSTEPVQTDIADVGTSPMPTPKSNSGHTGFTKNDTSSPIALSNLSTFVNSSEYKTQTNSVKGGNTRENAFPEGFFDNSSGEFDNVPGALSLQNRTRLSNAIQRQRTPLNASNNVIYNGSGQTSTLDNTVFGDSNTSSPVSETAHGMSTLAGIFNSTANTGIIGEDGRTRIEETENYPWSAVVELQIVTQEGQRATCSGAIIREEDSGETSYHMLTAAHCVYFPNRGGFIKIDGPDASRVVPAADGSTQPFGTVGIERIRTYEGWISSSSPAYDIALVTLENRVGNRTGSLQYTAASPGSSIYEHDETTVAGYPADKPPHTMWVDTGDGGGTFRGGDISNLSVATHRYQMDIFGGMSGGPVWVQDYSSIDGRRIVSVNAYSVDADSDEQTDFNMGTRLTPTRVNDFERWMAVDDGENLMNDQYEPNDDIDSATPIEGQEQFRNLRIVDGEFDVFAIELDSGEDFSSKISFDHGTGNLDMRLLGPNRSVIDESMSTTDDETVSAQNLSQSGTYYIAIEGRDDASVPYSLSVTTGSGGNEIESDRLEPNDIYINPTVVEQENVSLNNLSIGAGDIDFFAVDLGEGGHVSATISFDHSTGNLDMALVNPARNIIDRSRSVTDAEQVSHSEVTRDGKYYIAVYGYDGGATAPYSLSIEHGGPEPREPTNDRFEPNDIANTATAVDTETQFRNLQIVNGEYDIFSTHLASGDNLSATIDFDHGTGDLDLGLLGPNFRVVDQSGSLTDGENVSVSDVSRNGTYYLAVYGYDGASAPYRLSIDRSDDAQESRTVSLEPSSQSISSETVTTFDVSVGNVTQGIGAYNYTIEMENATVSKIRDVRLAGTPGIRDVRISEDNSSVTVVAALTNTEDTGRVQIGSVTVSGDIPGETRLNLSVAALSDEEGRPYAIGTVTDAVVVVTNTSGPGDVTGNGRSATDPDGDGLYEDVNGDGEFSVSDIQALFVHRGRPAVEENSRAFDFNGDGRFSVSDIQALFNQLD